MNKKRHTIKYIVCDFISAFLVWIIFNWIRKTIIESSVYGTEIKLEIHLLLVLNSIIVALFWIFIYWLVGYYNNIYKKSRLQEFYQTIFTSIIGVVVLFFALILDDIVLNYRSYYFRRIH